MYPSLLLTAAEATQHFNSYTKGIHAVLKGDEMLLGKNRRRGHDSHLLANAATALKAADGSRLAVSRRRTKDAPWGMGFPYQP